MVEQKRESFRVEFPRTYYPTINIQGEEFDVYDASEFGIRFYVNSKESDLTPGAAFQAVITFPDLEQFELKIEVVRADNRFISIKLLTPLPLSKIRAQHLTLIQRFSEKKAYS